VHCGRCGKRLKPKSEGTEAQPPRRHKKGNS
jgi:hypothetical protein